MGDVNKRVLLTPDELFDLDVALAHVPNADESAMIERILAQRGSSSGHAAGCPADLGYPCGWPGDSCHTRGA